MVGIFGKVPRELKQEFVAKALKERYHLAEYLAKAMAAYIGRPELGEVDRIPRGRPSKDEETATA